LPAIAAPPRDSFSARHVSTCREIFKSIEKRNFSFFVCGDFVVPATYSDKKPQDGRIKSERVAAYFQNEEPDISRMRI